MMPFTLQYIYLKKKILALGDKWEAKIPALSFVTTFKFYIQKIFPKSTLVKLLKSFTI